MVNPAAAVSCRVSILVAGDLGSGWVLLYQLGQLQSTMCH